MPDIQALACLMDDLRKSTEEVDSVKIYVKSTNEEHELHIADLSHNRDAGIKEKVLTAHAKTKKIAEIVESLEA